MLQSGTEIARIPQRRGATTRLEAQRIPITAQRENEAEVTRKLGADVEGQRENEADVEENGQRSRYVAHRRIKAIDRN